MRRIAVMLSSASLALALGIGGASQVTAAGDVDPSTLTPEPPPGATCFAVNTASVLCNTFKNFNLKNEIVFDLPCGHIYETSVDHRDGIRWYVHGKAVRKQVHGTLRGTWSHAKNGTGKVVKLTADWSEWTVWAEHGNDDTASATAYGLQFRATAPGLGNAIVWFGRVDPDNSSHGIKQGFRVDAQTLAADATVNADDLTPAAMSALAKVLC